MLQRKSRDLAKHNSTMIIQCRNDEKADTLKEEYRDDSLLLYTKLPGKTRRS